jgi:hypothetical protein
VYWHYRRQAANFALGVSSYEDRTAPADKRSDFDRDDPEGETLAAGRTSQWGVREEISSLAVAGAFPQMIPAARKENL